MFQNTTIRKIPGLHIPDKNVCKLSKLPPKYSDEDWDFNNKIKFRITDDQEKLAEWMVEESRRVVDESNETTKSWKGEVEHQLKERASEIRFLVDELKKQKKAALLEEEALDTYRNRVINAIRILNEKSLSICQKCLVMREGRLGVDLVDDEVDRQLRQELKVIKGCQALMDKTLKESNEQLRKLRAAMYLLDADLDNKDKSLRIDESNLTLKKFQNSRGENKGFVDHCVYSLNEWEHQTHVNLQNNTKELNSASQLRAYVDLLLKQVVEDMQNQTDRTNEALDQRIGDIRFVKLALERKHNDTINHINEVNKNIMSLKTEIHDKQGYLGLCQKRLGNRALRPGLELTCDSVQDALRNELNALNAILSKLNRKLLENHSTLRYLLHVQIMQEEEINIKTNSLKIDEIECMTIRQTLKYQSF